MNPIGNKPFSVHNLEPSPLNAPDPPFTGALNIHIVDVELDAFQTRLADFHLSEMELRRAAQYKVKAVRDRFIVRRGILRLLLAGYMALERIIIEDTPEGKPCLGTELAAGRLEFSVSSSEARALYAFAWNRRVGIDLEDFTKSLDLVGIAHQFFTPQESACIERLPFKEQKNAFFTCWTRKEAYIKAAGVRSLDSFDTGIATGIFKDLSNPGQNDKWSFIELPIGEEWKSCLALECFAGELPLDITVRKIVS